MNCFVQVMYNVRTGTREEEIEVDLEWNDMYSNPSKVAVMSAIEIVVERHFPTEVTLMKPSDINQINNSCFYSYRSSTGRQFYAKVS